MRNFSRREVLAGMLASAVVGLGKRAEAKPRAKNETEKEKQRRLEVHRRLHELWNIAQEKYEGHSIQEMLNDLKDYFGIWHEAFIRINRLNRVEQLVDSLADEDSSSATWEQTSGSAQALVELYDLYWDETRLQERRASEKQPKLDGLELAGLDRPSAEALFTPGTFLPHGWLSSVKKVTWKDHPLWTPFLKGNFAAGMALPTIDSYLAERGERRVILSGNHGPLDYGIEFMSSYDTFYHEFAHANDWDTGSYTVDFKVYMYWKAMQLVKALATDESDFELHSIQKKSQQGPYHRWIAVMEYWPTIFTKYMLGEKMTDEPSALVTRVLDETDSNFSRETALTYGREVLTGTALRALDQRADNNLAIDNSIAAQSYKAIGLELWQVLRTKQANHEVIDRTNLKTQIALRATVNNLPVDFNREYYVTRIEAVLQNLLDDLEKIYDPDRFWFGYKTHPVSLSDY